MSKLLSLIIVYFLHQHLKNYTFFQKLQQNCTAYWLDDVLFKAQMLASNANKIPIFASSFLLILAMSLIVFLLQMIFYHAGGNLGAVLFNVIILSYCLYSATKKPFSSIFVASFEHSFSLLFWFVILGPVGVVLYWLCLLGGTKAAEASELYYAKNINNCLFSLHIIAAWLPARITGLIFSLVGDFEQGFTRWKAVVRVLSMPHPELLDACGDASLGNLTIEQSPLLIERAFIAWVIFCILVALIF